MRILLQDRKTGLYLQESDIWIRDLNAALDFGNSQKAMDFARSRKLSDAQIVAAFTSERHVESVSYPIPLLPARSVRAQASPGR